MNHGGNIPAGTTFGYQVLEIPSLQEMGIPMAGYIECRLSKRLNSLRYMPCWIELGEHLLTYDCRCFQHESPPFLSGVRGDPWTHQSFEIQSPIRGLFLSLRSEQTVQSPRGIQYQNCNESLLPVILLPNDEPHPNSAPFRAYDRIAEFLLMNFDRIPVRVYSKRKPDRFRTYLAGCTANEAQHYQTYRETLRTRRPENHRAFSVREIGPNDSGLLREVQSLRTQDRQLDEALAHITRRYGTGD